MADGGESREYPSWGKIGQSYCYTPKAPKFLFEIVDTFQVNVIRNAASVLSLSHSVVYIYLRKLSFQKVFFSKRFFIRTVHDVVFRKWRLKTKPWRQRMQKCAERSTELGYQIQRWHTVQFINTKRQSEHVSMSYTVISVRVIYFCNNG